MSMKQPLRLPLQQSTVSDLSTGRDLPSLSKLRLTVWTICGKTSRSRSDFGGGDPRSPSMRAHGEHGRSVVADTLYLGQPTVGQFAKYLWFLYHVKRMAWSTIRLHRDAVATVIDPLTQNPLSQHPMICRFMKAVYLARPPARPPTSEVVGRVRYTF